MTAFHDESGIGERIQAARKQRGFRSTRDLAQAIPGGNITESILQNIEAGRKTDLSVSQLLNIALALRVAPAFLLAPLARSHDRLDLANLSDAFREMDVVEFESWFSGNADGAYRPTIADELSERNQLQALRELDRHNRELKRLTALSAIEQDGLSENVQPAAWDSFESRIGEASRQIDKLASYLESAGWHVAEQQQSKSSRDS